MKAMVLAAGLGTRLRPLTEDRPKALVTVAGRTLLEITLDRLRSFGIQEVMVNTHYRSQMIVDFLKSHDNFGMRIETSTEKTLLDTGGGLKRVADFFLNAEGDSQEPFILHNVDILSNIDLGQMARWHVSRRALATLAVQARKSSRYLLFNEDDELVGRRAAQTSSTGIESKEESADQLICSAKHLVALGFSGIHVLSPAIFSTMREGGAFSIIDTYLRAASEGEKIVAYHADGCYWRDIGRPESVLAAEADIATGVYAPMG